MPQVQRSSDVVETHSEKAITYGFGALVFLAFSALLFAYRGSSGLLVPLASVLAMIGLGFLGFAVYTLTLVRKVTSVSVECPYCQLENVLLEKPSEDFACTHCNRLVPVQDGAILSVQQVRCGFCNELNFYSEKTDCLLCEACNHEIPIAHEEGHVYKKTLAVGFAVQDDTRPYELILKAEGHKHEELISTLQQMLALNRNQVKQMLEELPVTLLTGIPKKKAEMLRAQLQIHDADADIRPLA